MPQIPYFRIKKQKALHCGRGNPLTPKGTWKRLSRSFAWESMPPRTPDEKRLCLVECQAVSDQKGFHDQHSTGQMSIHER